MESVLTDLVGWLATIVFIISFFANAEKKLKVLQAIGASIWIVYGLLIISKPVIVSNILVISAILLSLWRRQNRKMDKTLGL